MSHEMERWNQVDPVELPEVAPVTQPQVQRLAEMFDKYRQVLVQDKENGVPCHLIPESEGKSEQPALERGYFFRHDSGQNSHRIYGQITKVINDETSDIRLSIDPSTGIITDLDQPSRNFEDTDLLDRLIDSSEKTLSDKLKTRKKHELARNVAIGVAVTALAAAGATLELLHLEDVAAHRAQVRAADERIAFDRSGFNIGGKPYTVSQTELTQLAAKQFKAIPEFHDGDKFYHPRRFTLQENSCTQFIYNGNFVKYGEQVYLAVQANDAYASESYVVGIDTNGDLDVCSPTVFTGDTTSDQNVVTLAMQVK